MWEGPIKVRRGKWDAGIKGLGGEEKDDGEREGVLYRLVSKDGEEGFPGEVEAKVWYFEGRGEKEEVVLEAEYEVKMTDGGEVEETVVGMTNHRSVHLLFALVFTSLCYTFISRFPHSTQVEILLVMICAVWAGR